MSIRRSAIAFFAIALIASAALALDIPPKPAQWVNDYGAQALSAAEIQQLNEKLEGFNKRTGVQFLMLIFPSLEGEDDLGYTNKVANVWKVKDDKALMLFVFVKEHKTRIQVGYSMEPVITDAFSSDVLHETVPPYFRAGDYAGGLNAAIDRIWKKIDPSAVPAGSSPAPRAVSSPAGSGIPIRLIVYLILFLIFVVVPAFTRRGRRSGCGGCFWPMFFGGGGFGGGGTTLGGGGGSSWGTGGSWGGGGSSFGGGGAGGGW